VSGNGGPSRFSRALPVLIGGAAMLLAGCGGGDGSSTTESSTGESSTTEASAEFPAPEQPIGAVVPVLERALAGGDCADALAVVHPVVLPEPDRADSQANCEEAQRRLRFLGDFEVTESAEFGTAAIIDGVRDGEDLALPFALDEQLAFKWTSLTNSRHEVGTAPSSGVDFEASPRALIEALRAGDCRAAHKTLAPGTRLYYENQDQFCRLFDDNFTATPEGFGSRLENDPDADLVELGTTRDLAFYGVATAPAGYRTIIVSGSPGGEPKTRVVDVVPVER
jgi:hypothetical protein